MKNGHVFAHAWEYREYSEMLKVLPPELIVHIPGKIVKDFVHVFSSVSSGFGWICTFLRPKKFFKHPALFYFETITSVFNLIHCVLTAKCLSSIFILKISRDII